MFGLFSHEPSIKNSVSVCAALANCANIDVVLEKGNYSGFLIYIDADGASLADHFKHPDAQSAFIGVIEERISNLQFNDPSVAIEMVAEMREMTAWKPNMDAVRAVIGHGNKPLFRWEP